MSINKEYVIPLMIPNLCGNEEIYLKECIHSNQVSSLGDFIPKLEAKIRSLAGSPDVIATNSGTSALHAVLTAFGIGHGDLVIVQDYTFIATANAVSMTGASVWILGITQETRSLDPQILIESLRKETTYLGGALVHKITGKKVKAVIQTFTDGHPGHIEDLHMICKEFSLPLIIDGAGALGCEYKGFKLGGLGDAQIVSFNGNKTFTAGSGGAALITDIQIADLVRIICSVGRKSKDYHFDRVGFNYRMANVNAAICLAQLENYDSFLIKKRSILYTYKTELSEFNVSFLSEDNNTKSSCWTSNLFLEPANKDFIDFALKFLDDNLIQSRVFWKPIHLQTPYSTSIRTGTRTSDHIWSKIISLPSSTSLKEAEQATVISALKSLLTKL